MKGFEVMGKSVLTEKTGLGPRKGIGDCIKRESTQTA